jgi:hypothetical protein
MPRIAGSGGIDDALAESLGTPGKVGMAAFSRAVTVRESFRKRSDSSAKP